MLELQVLHSRTRDMIKAFALGDTDELIVGRDEDATERQCRRPPLVAPKLRPCPTQKPGEAIHGAHGEEVLHRTRLGAGGNAGERAGRVEARSG